MLSFFDIFHVAVVQMYKEESQPPSGNLHTGQWLQMFHLSYTDMPNFSHILQINKWHLQKKQKKKAGNRVIRFP